MFVLPVFMTLVQNKVLTFIPAVSGSKALPKISDWLTNNTYYKECACLQEKKIFPNGENNFKIIKQVDPMVTILTNLIVAGNWPSH